MTIYYLDTSAALKLLIEEDESEPLAQWLNQTVSHSPDSAGDIALCSSFLLYTELHCAARRRRELDEEAVATLLSGVELVDVSREHLLNAAGDSAGLRSADAIHLTVALDIRSDALLTYDREMRIAARRRGLGVVAPPDRGPCGGAARSSLRFTLSLIHI